MNLEGMLYPAYYILCPIVMVPQPFFTMEPERSQEESMRELQDKPDVLACEKEFKNFLGALTAQMLSQTVLEWQNVLGKMNRKNVPSIQEIQNIYSGGIERYKTYIQRHKVSWGQEDLLIFFWLLDKYCVLHRKGPRELQQAEWEQLARMIPFRNWQQCMFKYLSLQKYRLEDYPWDLDSEKFLFEMASSQQKKDWVSISRSLHRAFPEVYRSPKQCRQHYSLNLSNIFDRAKTFWTDEEDLALLDHYIRLGRRWKQISILLAGRSENAIKNRFSLLWSKYKKRKSNNDITEIREQILKRQSRQKNRQRPVKSQEDFEE